MSHPETDSQRTRVALKVPAEEVAFFAPANSPKAASRAVTAVLRAVRTLFGLPEPVRLALMADMKAKGMSDVQAYLTWLCVERHNSLSAPEGARRVG